ncbi:MAG TPA: FUSC family protein, partial [Paraburkholderia sp.]
EFLLSQLSYDHTHPRILERAQALRGRMMLFLPMMSSLADPLLALHSDLKVRPPGLDELLADVAKWFDRPLGNPSRADEQMANAAVDALHARIVALRPSFDVLLSWEGALLSNALWRLAQVIDMWHDCRSLRVNISQESATWRPRFRHWRLGGSERYFDRGMMLFAALSAILAIVIACGIWIESGWHDGAGAITLAAVACCFFAALDDPAPQVFNFLIATAAAVVIAGLYLFVVLPRVHDFAMLVVMFAGPFILAGTLIPRPQFNLVATLVAVNTATFISIQGAYDADFLLFLNSNIAGIAGLLYAYVWTRTTRPFGAELAAARLLRSSWADVALTASTEPLPDQRDLASRMLDRLMQLVPRLAASDENRHPSIESFRDLRIALNSLDLRRAKHRLKGELPATIDGVLAGVNRYYASCADRKRRQPVPRALMTTIDDALGRVTAQAADATRAVNAEGTAAGAPRRASQRWLREARHALVGLRLSLFPASAGQAPGYTGTTGATGEGQA